MSDITSITPSAKTSKEKFEVGFSSLMTSPVGLMLPCYVEDVKTGDGLKLSMSSFIRSQIVNSSAFQSFEQNVDFYFVPYRLIWSDYNNWRNTVPNPTNSNELHLSPRFIPNANSTEPYDIFLQPNTSWDSLASYLYGRILSGLTVYEYMTSGNGYFGNGVFFDNAHYADCLSVNYCLRLLDLLGYSTPIDIGNINNSWLSRSNATEQVTLYTILNTSWPFTSANPMVSYDNITETFDRVPRSNGVYQPITREKANFLYTYYASIGRTTGTRFNYFRLAAFNAIYQHFYRSDDYETFDPSTYNVDSIFQNSGFAVDNTFYGHINPQYMTSVSPMVFGTNQAALDITNFSSPYYYSHPNTLGQLHFIPHLSSDPVTYGGSGLMSALYNYYWTNTNPSTSFDNATEPSMPWQTTTSGSREIGYKLEENALAFVPKAYHSTGLSSQVDALFDKKLDYQINFSKLFTPHYANWERDRFTALKPTNQLGANFSTLAPSGLYQPNNIDAPDLNAGQSISGTSGYGTMYGNANINPFVGSVLNNFVDTGRGVDPDIQQASPLNTSTATENSPESYQGLDNSVNVSRVHATTITNSGSIDGAGSKGNRVYNILTTLFNSSNPVTRLQRDANNNSFLSADDIRFVMARDKFARSLVYSDKNYSALVKALFGESVSDPSKPVFLGHFSNGLSIDTITATADGENPSGQSSVGELYGRVGTGKESTTIFKSHFKEDGVVIGVQYIKPRNNYDSNRINRFNTLVSRFDHYYPHFDNLGLSPVFQWERSMGLSNTANTSFYGIYNNTAGSSDNPQNYSFESAGNIIGFTNRYPEFKFRENEVHGPFQSRQSLNYWTFTNNQSGRGLDPTSLQTTLLPSTSLYKILPNVSDRIFGVSYDGSPDTDPFMIFNDFRVTRISDLSIHGVANF